MVENVNNILHRISIGEATLEDRQILDSLDEDIFYSELHKIEQENYDKEYSTLDIIINETKEEILELDSKYSEVIPESNNISQVRQYAKNKGIVKRFLRKQRVKEYNLK